MSTAFRPARDFRSWLVRQSGRDDAIGDLAADVRRDRRTRGLRYPSALRFLVGYEAREALRDAVREYRIEARAARRAQRIFNSEAA